MRKLRISIGLMLLASFAAGVAKLESVREPGCETLICSVLRYDHLSPRIPENLRVRVDLDNPVSVARRDVSNRIVANRCGATASAVYLDFRVPVRALAEDQISIGL